MYWDISTFFLWNVTDVSLLWWNVHYWSYDLDHKSIQNSFLYCRWRLYWSFVLVQQTTISSCCQCEMMLCLHFFSTSKLLQGSITPCSVMVFQWQVLRIQSSKGHLVALCYSTDSYYCCPNPPCSLKGNVICIRIIKHCRSQAILLRLPRSLQSCSCAVY